MAAYDMLISLIQEYFISLGYNSSFIKDFFSSKHFKEIACISLANANVMIRNKTDHSSHQTHIAITGEMIDFFCPTEIFSQMDNETVCYWPISISKENLQALRGITPSVIDPYSITNVDGHVSWGKRTQKQIQLSKKNSLNSSCFNELRLGLYENDLLIMLKYRYDERIFTIGITQAYYLSVMPNFKKKYGTNTYLRLPKDKGRGEL